MNSDLGKQSAFLRARRRLQQELSKTQQELASERTAHAALQKVAADISPTSHVSCPLQCDVACSIRWQ